MTTLINVPGSARAFVLLSIGRIKRMRGRPFVASLQRNAIGDWLVYARRWTVEASELSCQLLSEVQDASKQGTPSEGAACWP